MKLGLRLDLFRSSRLDIPVETVLRAEELGYHSVWTAEAYGTDALSPLAYLAALTTRIKLATGVVQLAARTPAALAMHAMTIDALAGGGRTILGIGVSGPQIVEGWYGQPWGSPNKRLRDYVAIVRKVLEREAPLTHDGAEISLPFTGPGSTGQGKALKSIMHPYAPIPIWLAAGGPANTALAYEICDGLLPMGMGADAADDVVSEREGFEVFIGCTVVITDDVAATLDRMRPLTAMYVGGMGSATHNYHREAMARRGFPEAAERIQELWLAGRKDEAVAAVPDDYLQQHALIGTEQRIRAKWDEGFTPRGVTGLIVGAPQPAAIDLMAELAL